MYILLISILYFFQNHWNNNFFARYIRYIACDSVTDFSVLSNPADAQNVSCWDFVVGIFARKALLNSGRVISTLSC